MQRSRYQAKSRRQLPPARVRTLGDASRKSLSGQSFDASTKAKLRPVAPVLPARTDANRVLKCLSTTCKVRVVEGALHLLAFPFVRTGEGVRLLIQVVDGRRQIIHVVFIAYTAVRVLAWVFVGARNVVGFVDKAIEVLLILPSFDTG